MAKPFRVHGYLKDGFDIIAHRGSQSLWPENTLYAYAQALQAYPQAILELDVHRTRDGQVVVHHDDTTHRLCEKGYRIREKTFAELKGLDAAYYFSADQGGTFPHRGSGIRIPLLSEVLTQFPESRVCIDIKDVIPGHAREVMDVIEAADAVNRVIVASESHENLHAVRKLDARFATGYSKLEVMRSIACDSLLKGKFFPRAGDVLQIPVEESVGPAHAVHIRVLTPSLLEKAHSVGKKVHVWTINEESAMRALIELGVDGIVTDAVGLLTKVARELGKIL